VEVLAVIGRGGMGEVYRARDTKLKRDVAIKTLPDEFSHDADRLSRFQREAEVLASLNHPNIAAIYDLEEADGARFLVLELVEGETLDVRIKRGPIPIDETLHIAKSICEALEAAHEKGIIHRDLKPANVKVTAGGIVKVLDFGLAKVRETSDHAANQSSALTPLSDSGVIIGTAAYMSPEQAKGKPADRRSDIWAFGVVLFEMLTGRRLFPGETTAETLAAVMMKEPEWNVLPANTPPRLRELVRRCLIKDPHRRVQAMGEARLAIEEAQSGSQANALTASSTSSGRERLWMSVAVVTAVVAAAMAVPAVRHFRESPPAMTAEIRLDVNAGPTSDPFSFAISPDGRRLVFVASNEGKSQLWIRPLDSVSSQPLSGTDGASYPFWSPDSASVGFFANGKLKRVDTVGGAPQVLADAAGARGGAWNREGTILFAPVAGKPLFKVPAIGGEPVAVTRLETGQLSHRFPQFLPDGRHFIYLVRGNPPQSIYVGSLDGAAPKLLARTDAPAVVHPSGFLLFLRQRTLLAQVFDFKRQELSNNPLPVAEQVVVDEAAFSAGFSAASGIVAYRTGSPPATYQLTWLDRSGKRIGTLGDPGVDLHDVELSPDGERVAVYRRVNGESNLWLIDTARGVPTRFTFKGLNSFPLWSPDGNRVVYTSNRKGVYDLYWRLSSSAGADELLLESDQTKAPVDWSSDGRFLLFASVDPQTKGDLWVLPMFGDRKPFSFLKTPFTETLGQFSPDGKWIAYQSNESGQPEIYVQPFPGPGRKFQISTNGGAQPRWNKNGKEIFYVSLTSQMMAAPVRLSPDGQSLETGRPAVLFPVRIAEGPVPVNDKWQYAVSPNGQRFLVNLATEGATSPITLILNWKPPKP
jgi:serine/threonine protein kinase